MQQISFEQGSNIYQADMLIGKIAQEIIHKLSIGAEYEHIFSFIFDSLNFVIPYDRIGIAVLENGDTTARLAWVKSKGAIVGLKPNYSAPLSDSLEKIIQKGEPRIINDLRVYHVSHPQSVSTELALRDGILSSLTCPLTADNKSIGFVFFSSFQPNTYQDEHVKTFLAIAAEVSVIVEQARLKNYFREGESREKSLSQVIHDLRAPLCTIKSCLDLTVDEGWTEDFPEEAKKIYLMLGRTTQDALLMIEELLELRRVRDSHRPLEMQKVSLNDFFKDVSKTAELLAKSKEISVALVVDSKLPEAAEFDPQKIRRVLDNLISNALKFSKRGTQIKLEVKADDSRLVFAVSDQGLGICAEELPILFTEFGKTSTAPTEGEGSTGLGLSIAKEIVERHKGKISVSSQWGRGSTFTFWIPLLSHNQWH